MHPKINRNPTAKVRCARQLLLTVAGRAAREAVRGKAQRLHIFCNSARCCGRRSLPRTVQVMSKQGGGADQSILLCRRDCPARGRDPLPGQAGASLEERLLGVRTRPFLDQGRRDPGPGPVSAGDPAPTMRGLPSRRACSSGTWIFGRQAVAARPTCSHSLSFGTAMR